MDYCDKGLNESQIAETVAGNVLVAAGQAPGHRAFVLLDVDWLYETESFNGISYVRFRSAALRPDPNGFYVEYVRARVAGEGPYE